jgi:hypothetical protein
MEINMKLPYGISNFETIMTENYVYVDKTHFIEILEKEPNKTLFLTRPRKFGKSLFLSMLSHYYDIKDAGKFEKLFGNLYIGKHPTPSRNNYVVLNLDFSGLDTTNEESFLKSFGLKIESYVLALLSSHTDFLPKAREIADEMLLGNPAYKGLSSLNYVFNAAQLINKKVFVIIDEYDHFANDLIAMNSSQGDDVYQRMVRANSIVRDFYETLKAGTKTVIDRILLVGITPIMLDDMTSGFNIADNISLYPVYNEILGFTQEEICCLMEKIKLDKSLITIDLEYFYNGYMFHEDGMHSVYNASMMLYFFNQLIRNKKTPKIIIDENLKTDYGRLQRLIRTEDNRKQLMEIIQKGRIDGEVIPKFTLKQLRDPKCFVSMLFYMGLLTIDGSDIRRMRLKIPNYSIQTVYWEYIEEMTRESSEDVLIDLSRLSEAMFQLAYQGDPAFFIDYVGQNIVSRLSNRDLQQFDEKYLKIILLNNLFYGKYFIPISEMEISQGYTDIYLQRSHIFPNVPAEWIWEIKYIKKSEENNAALIEEKREQSRSQLKKYHASHLFANRNDIRYLSVIFIGKNKTEIEEIYF